MLPKAPDSELNQDADLLVQAITNYKLIHVEAYLVHVDMVLRNEVAFKLTAETIESLIEYHKNVHCVNTKANTYDWSEKEQQCNKLHEDFVQAVNKFIYRTNVKALEGLEEEGAGELLCGKSEEVKDNVLSLMKPLLPPPPRIVDVIRQQPLLPSSPVGGMWSHPTPAPSMPAVEAWRILPSSPSPVSSAGESTSTMWANVGMPNEIPSPTPSISTPYTTAGFYYSTPAIASPIPTLPLPSMLSPPCGVSVGMGGFEWDNRFQYAATM